MYVKSMFKPAVRSAGIRRTQQQVFSLFNLEFYATPKRDGVTRFYVAQIRAVDLVEARHLLSLQLNTEGMALDRYTRQFNLGKDRSWLYGNNAYNTEVVWVKQFCKDTYEARRQHIDLRTMLPSVTNCKADERHD